MDSTAWTAPPTSPAQPRRRPRPPHPLSLLRGAVSLASELAPGAVAHLTARHFLSPRPIAHRAAEKAVLATARRGKLQRPGAALATYTWGKAGPLVLLVHGWNGHAGQLTPLVAPLLAQGLRVVAFDAPGHGASEGRTSHVPAMAAALGAVAAALGDVTAVIAHSAGATACAYAAQHSPLAKRLAFVTPGLRAAAWVEAYAAFVGLGPSAHAHMREEVERIVGGKLADIDLARLAPAIACPTLFVLERTDPLVPLGEARKAVAACARALVLETEGIGHFRILRDASVIERLVAFAAAPAERSDEDEDEE